MPSPADRIDPIAILHEEAVALAIAHGADRCEEFAANLVRRFKYRMGGVNAYIRSQKAEQRALVAEEIRQRYNGRNAGELAREFHMTPRNVRYILSSVRRKM